MKGNFMIRKLLITGLCAAIGLVFAPGARAAYLTTNGTIQMMSPFPDPLQTGANPPLTEITQLSAGSGRIFTNQIDGLVGFAPGSTVRSIGTFSITQALNGDNLPVLLPDGTPMVAIFAVEGKITADPNPTALFTGGSVWLTSRVTDNPGGFNRDNPLSWNFDDVFAKFDLLPPETILPGSLFGVEGGAIAAPKSSVNKSSVNLMAGSNDGIFVFGEDLAFTPGGGFSNPGLGTFVGPAWLRDVENNQGQTVGNLEAIASFTDQTVNATVVTLTAAHIAELDTIFLAAYGVTGAFSGGNGYTPTPFGALTGDFNADLSSENYIITAVVVPEPSSLLLLGIGAGGLGSYFRMRLRRASRKNS